MGGGIRVLVVDDDEDAASTLASLLELEGYFVDVAANGRDALARLTERTPDVVVTDLLMPDMDGRALIRVARPLAPACTFILMSAHDGLDAARAGVTLVSKPIRIAELLDTVAAAVSGLTRTDRVSPRSGVAPP